jgi:hypothetical protein
MKKTYILAFLLLMICSSLEAQTNYEDRFRDLIGEERMTKIETSKPGESGFLAYLNAEGYYVSDVPEGKVVPYTGDAIEIEKAITSVPDLTLQLLENEQADLLGYAFEINETEHIYYSIGASGKLLVILPVELVRKNYETYLSQLEP